MPAKPSKNDQLLTDHQVAQMGDQPDHGPSPSLRRGAAHDSGRVAGPHQPVCRPRIRGSSDRGWRGMSATPFLDHMREGLTGKRLSDWEEFVDSFREEYPNEVQDPAWLDNQVLTWMTDAEEYVRDHRERRAGQPLCPAWRCRLARLLRRLRKALST